MREGERERERGRSIVHCHLVYYFWKFCTKVDCKFTCREERWELGSRQQNLCPPSYSYSSIGFTTSPKPAQLFTYDFYSISAWTEVFGALFATLRPFISSCSSSCCYLLASRAGGGVGRQARLGQSAPTVCPLSGRVSFSLSLSLWFNILCKLVMFLLCHCSWGHVCCLLTKAKSFVHLPSTPSPPPPPAPLYTVCVCGLYKIPRPGQMMMLLLLFSFLISLLFFLLLLPFCCHFFLFASLVSCWLLAAGPGPGPGLVVSHLRPAYIAYACFVNTH